MLLVHITGGTSQPLVASTASNSAGNNPNSFNYRNVPDVSLNADYNNAPYSYYLNGVWGTNGGTSAAAPLWAAFTALANELRAAGGTSPIGAINPLLYSIGTQQYLYETGQSSLAVDDFHDIVTGNNLYDVAVTGYDDATGWGSFIGTNLLYDLVHPPSYTNMPLPQPFYRLANVSTGTYYGTSMCDTYDLLAQNWQYIGVLGFAYNGQYDHADLVPLYKLVRTTPYSDNFFTTSMAEVQAAEANGVYSLDTKDDPPYGIQCYVFPDGSQPGTVPVWRGFDSYGHHVFTTTQSEAAGWTGPPNSIYTDEGVQFYILAP